MLVKIFGGIDVIAGILLIFTWLFSEGNSLLLIFAIAIIIKALLGFFQDFAGYIDFAGGLLLLLAYGGFSITFINVIAGILVLQKGVLSFL